MIDPALVQRLYANLLAIQRARKTTTYLTEGRKLGRKDGRFLWRPLWVLGQYCLDHKAPCINALVTLADGRAGRGTVTQHGRPPLQEILAVLRERPLPKPSDKEIRAIWVRLQKKRQA